MNGKRNRIMDASENTIFQEENMENQENDVLHDVNRRELIETINEINDDLLEKIYELSEEPVDLEKLEKYTEKKYKELNEDEKKNLIEELEKADYLKFKNCYIARSKLLFESSETLIKEVKALNVLNDLGYSVYLLPFGYARNNQNFLQKSADTLANKQFLEFKNVISVGETAGESAYKDSRKQSNNVFLYYENDINEKKAIHSIIRYINASKKALQEKGLEYNYEGEVFFHFGKTGKTKLVSIDKEGFVKDKNLQEFGLKNIEEAQSFPIVELFDEKTSPLPNSNINQLSNNVNTEILPTEYLTEKINASGINIHLSKEEMKAILEAGKDVQKLAVKYGTNQNIESENENTFNGYGTYVVSVNEENARQLGIKIASRKYGGTFYINNQPLSQFLQEKNFSPYWLKRLEQLNTNSVDNLSHEILMANVGGNPTLEKEQTALATLLSLDLVEYKREQTYLYSVEIPDNDNTNYLLYNNPIGIDQATKINNELVKMGVEWRASRNDIGKNIYFELLSKKVFDGNQKAASEFLKENVGFVGMQMDHANYIIFNDKDMSINNRVQYMKSENGEVYGFAFDGEIYIDEDLVNSNVLAHEYTHIWDNYVQKNNPELWQKGMTCLKGTSLWYEITEDKNYENLRTDDEILSECHARIVGKMAEQILERIAARDGELTKDKIIDWDREVSEYVATELLIKPELGDENYISESVKAEYLKEFLSMPMKDLMNELKVQMGKEKKVENEAIHLKSNIVEDMSEDIKDIYSKKEQFIKLNLSPVSDWLIKKEKEVGIDISGYMHQITTDFMKHTLNNHGDEKSEEQRGNIAITEDDFTNIQSVFEKPDLVVLGLRRKNEDMIIYTKKLEDGTTVYMEEILSSKKNQALRSKTMYKSKNEISIEKLEKILRENKQNDCSKMIITLGEVAISSVSYSEPNSVGSQIQHPTGDGISLHQNNDIVNKNYIRKKLSVEGGRSSINHLDNQDSAASISARTDTEKLQQNNVVVNSLSESNTTAKIQKYAESIDNSQTENSEESVEKSSKGEKLEIPVVCGEIKSILGNKFTGGNIKLSQDFQHELIEKGLVNPEEEFVLINDAEAIAQGCKIKSDQPFVFLSIPVENNGKTDFVLTKYYHVSALEEFTQETEVKNEENQIQEEQPKIIIPEFAMITQHGLKTYTNMVVDNYEEHTKSYLLKSQDGQETVRITENTLKELTSNEHQQKAQSFDENTKAAEKMIETQYKDFFEPRKNCANNFRHNLSVFCRKEANSPLDALKVANSLISQMSKEEKRKTKDLLNLLRKDGQTVNEVIIDTYHEAVKEVPLNEEYLNNKRYDKMIARPMYDTITDKGQKLDRDFNLKIGDSVKVTFKVDKNAGTKFSLKKENLFQECTIISSSKEANKVTLMDGNKSFYDVPRDTFLKEYAKREKIEHKQEQKKQRSYSMKLDVERGF